MPEPQVAPTPWAFQVGSILGIPIRVHWTFALLLLWMGSITADQGAGFLVGVMLTLLLFGCVALHEVGHAAMARRFGVRTFEIVLYPIGGLARLAVLPTGLPELMVALAGPTVNLILGLAMVPFVGALGTGEQGLNLDPGSLAFFLMVGNFLLFGLNLIPAFPMDGGRILRAFLSLSMPAAQATQITAMVGQGCALLCGILGIFTGQFLLVLVALLVFFGSSQEAAFFRRQGLLRGRRVREAMMTRFARLAPQDPIGKAAQLLLHTPQQDFPVVDAWGRAAGVVTRDGVMAGLGRLGPDTAVLEVMDRQPRTVGPEEDLGEILSGLRGAPPATILVADDDVLVGMISGDSVGRLLGVLGSLAAQSSAPRS